MIASISIVTYPRDELRWAFGRMGLDRPDLVKTPGLTFKRLVGTAKGTSFAWKPDLLRWGLVAGWESEAALDAFLAESPIVQRWHEHAAEVWTMRMIPVKSAGAWGGANPFPAQPAPPGDGPFAVITRATLRFRKTRAFYTGVGFRAGDEGLRLRHGCTSRGDSPSHAGALVRRGVVRALPSNG